MYKPKLQDNLQVAQPNVEQLPEGNGWPTPLTDESSPLKQSITNGRNGESNNMEDLRTSQMKEGGHHLAEGQSGATATQPNTGESKKGGDPLKTSQQKGSGHDTPEGE
jgi:hypothetical protein